MVSPAEELAVRGGGGLLFLLLVSFVVGLTGFPGEVGGVGVGDCLLLRVPNTSLD